jgi:50S ribosomal subunit-associated GTPase HflX
MRELRKVIERSDVIIQVLDARDPEGTRSRWVEEEVRKREADGKKLLAVVNKIGECVGKIYLLPNRLEHSASIPSTSVRCCMCKLDSDPRRSCAPSGA